MSIVVTYRDTESLAPYKDNARTHPEHQIEQIIKSIKEFGFNNPVLVDASGGLISGHGRIIAAKRMGIKQVPVVELAHLTPAQKKAFILADNKTALGSGWDLDILAGELESLLSDDFDLDLTGFDDAEIDEIRDAVNVKMEAGDSGPGTTDRGLGQKGKVTVKPVLSVDQVGIQARFGLDQKSGPVNFFRALVVIELPNLVEVNELMGLIDQPINGLRVDHGFEADPGLEAGGLRQLEAFDPLGREGRARFPFQALGRVIGGQGGGPDPARLDK